VIRGWQKKYEKKCNLYSLPHIIRMIKSRRTRWRGHAIQTGDIRNAYNIFVGTPEEKRTAVRPRYRWETIKWFLGKSGLGV
jgi:hypothetical protein